MILNAIFIVNYVSQQLESECFVYVSKEKGYIGFFCYGKVGVWAFLWLLFLFKISMFEC